MTPRDIGNLSYPELEDLMEGMEKNAKREKEEIGGKKKGDATDLLNFALKKGGF